MPADDAWDDGPGLGEAVRRYWWLLALLAVLGGGAGYGLAGLQPTEYEASAELLLKDPGRQGVFNENAQFTDPLRYLRNQAERIRSSAVAERSSRILAGEGVDLTPSEVMASLESSASVETDLLTVTATAPGATEAAAIANAVAAAYQSEVRAEVTSTAEEAVSRLEESQLDITRRLTRIQADLADDPDNAVLRAEADGLTGQLALLENRAEQIGVNASLHGSGVEYVEEAVAPETPARPRPRRSAAVGVVVGLGLGAAGAWLLNARRSSNADSRQDPAAVLGAPLLGPVPDFRALKVDGYLPTVTEPRSPASEAYQFVLSSMLTALSADSGKMVLVTSAAPEDGKTVTALNLAAAASHDEMEVLLVDADARVHGLSRLCGLAGAPGLHELQSDPDTLVWSGMRHAVPGAGGVEMVPTGAPVADPAGFFRSSAFRRAMQRVRDHADLVLVDSPPLLAVADTTAVAEMVDGIVLVVAQGTAMEALEEVRQRLAFIGTPLLGYIFNRADARSAPYSYYSYQGEIEPPPAPPASAEPPTSAEPPSTPPASPSEPDTGPKIVSTFRRNTNTEAVKR